MRPRGIVWDLQPLGRVRDGELATRLGVWETSVAQARRRRHIAPLPRGHVERLGAKALLGVAPDAEVATQLGLPVTAIRDARRRAGIRMDQRLAPWAEIDPRIGTLPDLHLARESGVSCTAIQERRVARGIAAYAPERRCACGRRFGAYRHWMRFCSARCACAGRFARRRGGHEDLHVALRALRREIRRRT